MGRKKIFGITLYNKIEREGKVPCIEKDSNGKDCPGEIKYVRTRIENSETEIYYENTFFYRCTRNCGHKWKAIQNNLTSKLFFTPY